MADRLRIAQVLNNLLSNAERHSPEGSVIRVSASRRRFTWRSRSTTTAWDCRLTSYRICSGSSPRIRSACGPESSNQLTARSASWIRAI